MFFSFCHNLFLHYFDIFEKKWSQVYSAYNTERFFNTIELSVILPCYTNEGFNQSSSIGINRRKIFEFWTYVLQIAQCETITLHLETDPFGLGSRDFLPPPLRTPATFLILRIWQSLTALDREDKWHEREVEEAIWKRVELPSLSPFPVGCGCNYRILGSVFRAVFDYHVTLNQAGQLPVEVWWFYTQRREL